MGRGLGAFLPTMKDMADTCMGLEVPEVSKQVWHQTGGFGVDHV